MKYLSNAFSLQMLSLEQATSVNIQPVTAAEVPADCISAIGHADTARVVSNILNRDVQANRISLTLSEGDTLYVAQLTGGRLPEGATTLPEGFALKFIKVTL